MDQLKSIFKKNKNDILFLKKTEFDIYYSLKNKYPLVVVEDITQTTGQSESGKKIIRKEIEDPFKEDKDIPSKNRLTAKDYKKYMKYGGSMGHNAPAGHHKTNLDVYSETFLLSNMCPQEIVFNSSLWIILETWCYRLKYDTDLYDIKIFTGSIPSKKDRLFDNITMNVPDYMYKLVVCKHKKFENNIFIGCFLMENKQPTEKIHKIYKFLISLKELSDLTNINFFILFNKYLDFNPTTYKISSIKKIARVDVQFNHMLSKQMVSALHYGYLIYSNTLKELEDNWNLAKDKKFDDEFHKVYYDLCKKRLKKEEKKSSVKKKSSRLSKSSKVITSSKIVSTKSYAKSLKQKKKSSKKSSKKNK
jgi:DNA/RNA endonuclease G (NUC1)